MTDGENLFNSCSLDVVVPNAVVEIPEWTPDSPSFMSDMFMSSLEGAGERSGAFFGVHVALNACL